MTNFEELEKLGILCEHISSLSPEGFVIAFLKIDHIRIKFKKAQFNNGNSVNRSC